MKKTRSKKSRDTVPFFKRTKRIREIKKVKFFYMERKKKSAICMLTV
jgi:hypothetical protein